MAFPQGWIRGPAYAIRRDPLTWIPRWVEAYGDLFTIRTVVGSATVVTRPEWARQVLVEHYARYPQKSQAYEVLRILFGNGLVTSEGEFWRQQRRLIQPAFHRNRLNKILAMMVERAKAWAERVASDGSGGKAVDLLPIFSGLTLDIVSRAMFGTDVEKSAASVAKHIHVLNAYALRMLRHPWMFLLPRRVPTPFNFGPYRSMKALNDLVLGIIQERRRQPGAHDDLLAMLLAACDEESGRRMDDQQLRDEVMTIFVAGHETTANAMAWVTYLLSEHPEIEAKLLAEIDTGWVEDPAAIEPGHFPYTRQVIEEAMRLYPPIWSVGRRCAETDRLGDYGIPVGMNMVMPIFYFHWSERFWTEPTRFDPARFASDRRPAPEEMIYFPFGTGPRSCIGSQFALQELVVMTVVFYRYLRFRLEPGFPVEPEPLITLRPKHGMRMTVKPRMGRGGTANMR